ncbi:hypothetical protein ABIA48_001463 [Pseudomonas sp. S30_BP2TU TE3576]|jgi:hypothetical protein
MIGGLAGLIASKLAPTGFVMFADFVYDTDTVGASLLAMRPDQSPQNPDNHYRSRIASVRAFNTGLSK